MKPRNFWIALLVVPSLALLSVPAAAITKSWDLPGLCTPTSGFKNGALVTSASPYTNAPGTCAGTGELASVSALSDTGAGGLLQSAYIGDYGSGGLGTTSTAGATNTSTSTTLDGAVGTLASGTTVDTGNGITSESTAQPSHAMDNQYNKESILLTFNTSVSLASFQIGYANTDSDMQVLAYIGSGNPGLASKTYGGTTGLLSNGWALVGTYANVVVGANQAIGTIALSSYWLITAFNSVLDSSSTLSQSNDFVKLLAITANIPTTPPSRVPEPSTLLLAAIAMASLMALRRRGFV